MAHLKNCMEISLSAGPLNGNHLAQIYDELCRGSWTEKAMRGRPLLLCSNLLPSVMSHILSCAGDVGFCIKAQSELKDQQILERARRQLEEDSRDHMRAKSEHPKQAQAGKY